MACWSSECRMRGSFVLVASQTFQVATQHMARGSDLCLGFLELTILLFGLVDNFLGTKCFLVLL
jgi:hypothetical protein